MIQNYEHIIEKLKKWECNGNNTLLNGTVLICKVPHVAPQAWLHILYSPLQEVYINQLETKLTKKIPQDLRVFFSVFNGINIFSDSLSIWGMKSSYSRTDGNEFQPYDLIALNEEKHYDINENWIVFGSYSWDGSYMIFDLESDLNKVFRCDSDSNEKLQEWPNLSTWLNCEIERLSQLFDENGIEYNEELPTIPFD